MDRSIDLAVSISLIWASERAGFRDWLVCWFHNERAGQAEICFCKLATDTSSFQLVSWDTIRKSDIGQLAIHRSEPNSNRQAQLVNSWKMAWAFLLIQRHFVVYVGWSCDSKWRRNDGKGSTEWTIRAFASRHELAARPNRKQILNQSSTIFTTSGWKFDDTYLLRKGPPRRTAWTGRRSSICSIFCFLSLPLSASPSFKIKSMRHLSEFF